MRQNLPKTPFSAPFSSTMEETRGRIENIVRGGRKRPALVILLLAAAAILVCGWIFSCHGADEEAQRLIRDYYAPRYTSQTLYLQEDAPKHPKAGEHVLREAACVGRADLGDGVGELWEVQIESYDEEHGLMNLLTLSSRVVLERESTRGEYTGAVYDVYAVEDLTTEQIIRQAAWGLMDWEATLWREGAPRPVGIGGQGHWVMGEAEETVTVHPDYEPIYQEGAYYATHSWPGLEVLSYHSGMEDAAIRIETTQEGLATPRGIQVGSTRVEVEAAYPEATPYVEDGLTLLYDRNPEYTGIQIYFIFADDRVSQITMVNQFN